jgi:hypothetical protein
MEIIYPDESLCLAAGEIKATQSVSLVIRELESLDLRQPRHLPPIRGHPKPALALRSEPDGEPD